MAAKKRSGAKKRAPAKKVAAKKRAKTRRANPAERVAIYLANPRKAVGKMARKRKRKSTKSASSGGTKTRRRRRRKNPSAPAASAAPARASNPRRRRRRAASSAPKKRRSGRRRRRNPGGPEMSTALAVLAGSAVAVVGGALAVRYVESPMMRSAALGAAAIGAIFLTKRYPAFASAAATGLAMPVVATFASPLVESVLGRPNANPQLSGWQDQQLQGVTADMAGIDSDWGSTYGMRGIQSDIFSNASPYDA